MQTFKQALIALVVSGEVDRETAANAATQQARLPRRARPRAQGQRRDRAGRPRRLWRRRSSPSPLCGIVGRMRRLLPALVACSSRSEAPRLRPARRTGVHGRSLGARDAPLASAETPNASGSSLPPRISRRARIRRPAVPELLRPLAERRRDVRRSPGKCSRRSTRSSPTSAGTWARARPAPSAGCSSCPPPG